MVVAGLTLSGEDVGHLLALSLAALVRAQALLGDLQSALVLGQTQQLENAALVGSEAGNLFGDVAKGEYACV